MGRLIPLEFFTPTVAAFVTLFHTYILCVIGANVGVLGMYVLIYIFYATYILSRELHLGRKTYRAEKSLRIAGNLRHIYRTLQICNTYAMVTFGKCLFVFQGAFTFLPMYINSVLIRYWDKLELFAKGPLVASSLFATIFWTVVLQVGGYLFVQGRKTIFSWKVGDHWMSRHENKLMRKFAKSCTPIVLCYGKQFVVKKLTLLKYHKGVGRGIFRALLATKKS